MDHLRNMLLHKDSLKLINDLKLHKNRKTGRTEIDEALSEIIGDIHITGELVDLGSDVLSDLEVEMTYSGQHCDQENACGQTLLGRLNTCKLLGGSRFLAAIVLKPVCDLKTLELRKHTIKSLREAIHTTHKNEQSLWESFACLSKCEQDLLWMYKLSTSELDSLYDMVYFTSIPLKPLNMSSFFLTTYNLYRIVFSPVIGCLSPFTMIVMPYILLKSIGIEVTISVFLKVLMKTLYLSNGSSYGYVSIAFTIFVYFQNILNSVELSRTSYTICEILTDRMNNVMTFLENGQALYTEIGIETFDSFCKVDNTLLSTLKSKQNKIAASAPKFSLSQNFGDQLNRFKMFNKDTHRTLINCIYLTDALCCIYRITTMQGYSFSNYRVSLDPVFSLVCVFHPCIDAPILNDIALGDMNANNIILTSPNGSGKSVLIKSILIAAILAQSIVVTCAQCCYVTPFSYISSQINIPDCKGKESLFEAEMHRSKNHLDSISKLRNDEFSFICTDEMFNSTSAIEGVAAAYAVIEQMSRKRNCLNIVSTHYLYLTRLTSEHPGLFENYKMNCLRTESGDIRYPHKLTRGISSQHIALDLLLQNGFDPFLVNSAKDVVKRLTQKRRIKNACVVPDSFV